MGIHLTGTPPLVRAVNRQLILEHIRRRGPVSRAELAKITSIRPPTVSAVIQQLIHADLVEEIGNGETDTGTGRPPRLVALSRRRPRALGFEIGATVIRAGLCHLDGTLHSTRTAPHAPTSPVESLGRLHAVGEELLSEAGMTWGELDGVGIALPGLVDADHSMVRWSRPLDWHRVPFASLAGLYWGTKTEVINNSVAASMAEHYFGAARDVRSLIYVFIRFDVLEHQGGRSGEVVRLGSGIIINAEPYHGEFGAAGEITTLVDHPRMHARDALGQPAPDTPAFVEALRRGEPTAVSAMARAADEIGTHVLDAINFLDPAMVVVDSDYEYLRDAVLRRLVDVVRQDGLRKVVGQTAVVASSLGEFAMARGSVAPTLRRLFRMPRVGGR